MSLAEFERKKDEKIEGVIYDMSPSPGYHPDVNDDYLCPDIMVICDRKH